MIFFSRSFIIIIRCVPSYFQLSIKKNVEIMNRSISSILRIESAQMSDAGSYICRTSASQMGKVIVDVLNGTITTFCTFSLSLSPPLASFGVLFLMAFVHPVFLFSVFLFYHSFNVFVLFCFNLFRNVFLHCRMMSHAIKNA